MLKSMEASQVHNQEGELASGAREFDSAAAL
jgi:hypothetical protein